LKGKKQERRLSRGPTDLSTPKGCSTPRRECWSGGAAATQ
jgi:hypothetical protein